MSLRGLILANKDWTIEYINSLSTEELSFVAHYIIKEKEESFERLGVILGTSWTKERVDAFTSVASSSTEKLDKFNIPLSYLIRPELKEMLKPKITVGDRVLNEGEVESLADLPKEDFLRMMRTGNWAKTK